MLSTLRQLLAYERWADAQHLHVLFIYERAYADEVIRRKLEHIHAVQRAYLAMFRGQPVNFKALSAPFATPEELAVSFRRNHKEFQSYLASVGEDVLGKRLPVDWFEQNKPTYGEAMLQVFLHSQSHRGQNAMRMRDLGWKPPLIDFVIWIDRGQPEPDWPH